MAIGYLHWYDCNLFSLEEIITTVPTEKANPREILMKWKNQFGNCKYSTHHIVSTKSMAGIRLKQLSLNLGDAYDLARVGGGNLGRDDLRQNFPFLHVVIIQNHGPLVRFVILMRTRSIALDGPKLRLAKQGCPELGVNDDRGAIQRGDVILDGESCLVRELADKKATTAIKASKQARMW